MEQIEVTVDDFDVFLNEKNKLYKYYGNDYNNELPGIYEKLANILNSDTTFGDLVNKRVLDKDIEIDALEELKTNLLIKLYDLDIDKISNNKTIKSVSDIDDKETLKKIENIFSDSKEVLYFDILYSIVKLVFENYTYGMLNDYLSSRVPELANCYGAQDIKQCDFLIERYYQFIDSLKSDATPSKPIIDSNGCLVIQKKDLFHGTSFSSERLKNIASRGLETGQLHGIDEDGETFCCVDFFKAVKDSTADEVCTLGKSYTNGNDQVVFVINHSDVEGDDAMFEELTKYDAYNEDTDEGKMARQIVNVAGLPLNHETGAAILMGVPPCMISSIIVNSGIEDKQEKMDLIASLFPKAYIFSRSSGKVLREPVIDYSNQK